MILLPVVCPYCRYVRKIALSEEEIRGEKPVVIYCAICGNLFPLYMPSTICTAIGGG